MKIRNILFELTLIYILSISLVYAQDSSSFNAKNLIGGSWNVCISDSVYSNYKCPPEWILINLKFEQNGNLIEREQAGDFKGKYTYEDNVLDIRIPKGKNTSLDYINFKIVWIDENQFYSVQKGDRSGIAIYYFEKIK